MRAEGDKFTGELPGIPPLPGKKPTQDARRTAADYQGPKVRQRCESCTHCDVRVIRPDSWAEAERMRCKLGDFPVLRGGICKHWLAIAGGKRG